MIANRGLQNSATTAAAAEEENAEAKIAQETIRMWEVQ